MRRTGRPTIKDLAELAGVSKTAVSFAFNSPERISRETYEKIMAMAQELGYVPDPVARGLARRKTQCIGILLPQSIAYVFQNPYITELLRGVAEVCEGEKFSILVLSPLEGIFTHAVYNAVVDGVIILGAASASEVQQVCRQRGLAYVTVDAGFSGGCINIGIDEDSASYQLARILLDAGHRRLCVCTLQPLSEILEPSGSSQTIRHRREGIQRAMDECQASNVEVQFLEMGTSYESSFATAKEILSQENRPTGIFCMADVQAHGFYGAAQELGLSIPKDLSIVTFDNLPQSQLLYPRPTAVDQSGFKKGWLAATELFKLLGAGEAQSVVMDFQILKTGSVASPSP